jgi:hypothetical protein
MKIILILYREDDGKIVVSHGVDEYCRNIILPCERLTYFQQHCGAKFDAGLGEWYIEQKEEN